mgnify:CR=1 FL=1
MADFSKVVEELKVQTTALNKLAGIVDTQQDEIKKQGKDARRVAAGQKAYQTRMNNAAKNTDASEVEDQNQREKSQSKLLGAILKTKDGIMGVGNTLGKFAKDKGKEIKGNIFGMLKKLAFGAAVGALLAFLNSEYWEKTKVILADQIIPALTTLYDTYLKPWFTSIGNISKNFKNMLEDPSWENLTAFFGSAGSIVLAIGAVSLLLAPLKTLKFLTSAVKLLATAFSKSGGLVTSLTAQTTKLGGSKFVQGLKDGIGGLAKGLTKLGGNLSGMVGTGTKTVAKGAVRGGTKIASVAGTALKGAAVAAKGALRFAGPIGLIATAAFGIFDGVKAGLEEAKKETSTAGSIVKESVSGLLSGLTFGLIEQKTISDGITKISTGITDAWNTSKTAISNGASALATKTTEAFNTAKTAFNDGFDSVKAGINKVVTDPEGAFNAATAKITELTGIALPDFADVKTGITNLGANIKERAGAIKNKFEDFTGIEIPTFTLPTLPDLKDKAAGLFDDLKSLELPKVTLPTLPDLKEKFKGIWDSLSIPKISFPDFSDLNPFANFSEKLKESKAFDIMNFKIFGREFGLGEKLKGGLMNLFGTDAPEGREKGGPIERGEDYVVGEAGPELFLPRGSGYIIPNNTMAALRTGAVAQGSVKEDSRTSSQPIVINAPTTNNNIKSGGGRGGLIPMQVGDNDPTLRAIAANTF